MPVMHPGEEINKKGSCTASAKQGGGITYKALDLLGKLREERKLGDEVMRGGSRNQETFTSPQTSCHPRSTFRLPLRLQICGSSGHPVRY